MKVATKSVILGNMVIAMGTWGVMLDERVKFYRVICIGGF